MSLRSRVVGGTNGSISLGKRIALETCRDVASRLVFKFNPHSTPPTRRYEDSNAELPRVLNSHGEEVRTLQTRCKQLKQQCRQANDKLKEREMELQQLRDQHKHLTELSKDRNLLEREKLQMLVTELTEQVNKQNETISTLQRRITLEAKNFKHQLQLEISKHKDTRHDLDLAINNADKLSSIIELKERLLNNGNGKRGPVIISKPSSHPAPTTAKTAPRNFKSNHNIEREDFSSDDQVSKICENSRYVSSGLSQEENQTSDGDMRSRSALTNYSRTTSSKSGTPTNDKKNSSNEENLLNIAKTVQESMSNMISFREEISFESSQESITEKMTILKADLLNKIKNDDLPSRKSSGVRRISVDSISVGQSEVQKSRLNSRRGSAISYKSSVGGSSENKQEKQIPETWASSEVFNVDNKTGTSLDNYCKSIMQDMENSSRVIDEHMKEYNSTRFDTDHLVQQLESLDKLNAFVSNDNLSKLPTETLEELNNNFKTLGSANGDAKPVPRKRSIAGAKTPAQKSGNAFGDASMSNQDLLNDLLGK